VGAAPTGRSYASLNFETVGRGGPELAEISRFEDLEAWKLARELARKIYRLTKSGLFAKDYGFTEQLRRAAISVMNNIAEGFDRGTNKDFVKFLFIARGSAAEVRSMLCVALDQGYLSEEEFEECRILSYVAARSFGAL